MSTPTPLWSAPPAGAATALPADADLVVVGAGITGLAVAVEAAQRGLDVVVVEDRGVGRGTTGLSTAKVTVLHGLRYSSLANRHGPALAARYAEAQRAGMAWLRTCAEEVLESATAYTYAADESSVADVRAEVDAGRAAGIETRWEPAPAAPFPTAGAVAVDDQAQVDPFALLEVLRRRLLAHGGALVEGCRVTGVQDGRRGATVRTRLGDIASGWVVVATGLPFLNRSLLFARTEPTTSYCIGVRTPDSLPDGMYLSAGEPVRSVRTAADSSRAGERVLVVGGAGHKTGAVASTEAHYRELVEWTREHFTVDEVPWRWSAEDFVPDDGLPFVGPVWPLPTRTLVATGYAKWGFTNAAAAALALVATMTGAQAPAWSRDWTPSRFDLRRGGREAARANADVARKLIGGWLGRVARGDLIRPSVAVPVADPPAPVSAVCTHLGGIVRWNDGDGCWDCPLHGSKFAADGTLLHGPAVRDLRQR